MLPLRRRNERLERDNEELHRQLTAERQEASSKAAEYNRAAAAAARELADVRFLASQQVRPPRRAPPLCHSRPDNHVGHPLVTVDAPRASAGVGARGSARRTREGARIPVSRERSDGPGGPSYSARLLLQAYSPIPPAEVEPAADAKGSSAGAYSAEARVRLAAAPPTLPCARPIRRPLRLWLARAPQSPPWLRGAFLPACRSRCSSGSSRRRSAKMPPWPLP
mmetsp:Transcript_23857/g.73026  ORF Transcript_23857/g.73026 Transcript_23857/m.73026 type:complete len:223 (+) Transcript_23857:1030-1698(+)